MDTEELGLGNILSDEDAEELFSQPEETQEPSPEEEGKDNKETEDNKDTTEVVVDKDTLFTEEPESVGSEDSKDKEDTESNKDDGISPNNFYSSIANALKEDGILPDLDNTTVEEIKDAEGFASMMEQQIQNRLDEKQKRIDDALNANVEPDMVRKYESALSYLDSIEDSAIEDESDKGELLRKQLIYQDYINKGFSKERAERYLNKSLESGTDVEDAKEALQCNKDFFKGQYKDLIDDAKKEEEKARQDIKEESEKLRKSIMDNDKVFGDIQVDKSTRQRIFDNISKPVYKDPETGNYYTALQKYRMENKSDFIKNVGILFTLTDGFKNLGGLVKGKVKKEVKKGLRELEHKVNNTARTSDGILKFVSGVGDDPDSHFSKWDLDI